MDQLIEPKLLKGFRDFLPAAEQRRLRVMRTLQDVFDAFGFAPIDTPILEYTEILLGKGGGETDKQVYRFTDNGGRDVAMRYDLTVPFARFMAAHLHELYLPFKRFHMAKAFRGENTQRGRYREFVQCDFDTVGTDSASADFEILHMIDRAFAAIGVEAIRIHVAHRGVLNALLEALGTGEAAVEVLRTVDRLRKSGKEEVEARLTELLGGAAARTVLALVAAGGGNAAVLAAMRDVAPSAAVHVDRLDRIVEAAAEVGFSDRIVIDPSITRGLDYYTGIVFETFLDELPEIGSVCSGGRYDDLASLFTKERLPGVGASIGLDRLMAALEETGAADSGPAGADTIVLCLDERLLGRYHALARSLREEGLRVEVYPEPRKPAQQYALAEKKAIPTAILLGSEEEAAGTLTVRDLRTRRNTIGVSPAGAAAVIRGLIGRD